MLLAALAAFAGAFVQSATGMGFALVLSPALFAVMDPEEAVTAVLILGAAGFRRLDSERFSAVVSMVVICTGLASVAAGIL
jgi:uncharacterized membrane protein YfcA